ncbi:hypothetical protein BASA81_000239 [Batrachochytrium salamandrivorans]|nr:hypothetical protein BASA81_000239 [Batrachochytrium salamandrivorans]
MRLLCLVVAALASALSDGSNPVGLVRNILLPSNEPNLHPYLLDFNDQSSSSSPSCWRLATSSQILGFEDDGDDSLVKVSPVPSSAASDFTQGDCAAQFEISIRAESVRKSGLRSLLFENAIVPGEVRRVDVHTNLLRGLEIITTTRRLEIGEEQTLMVIGKDQYDNVFTWLQGLGFEFKFLNAGGEYCHFTGKNTHNQIVVRGVRTGRSTVAVYLPNQLSTTVDLIVARQVLVCPGELVSFPHTLNLADDEFQFCLAKRQGCYSKPNAEFSWKTTTVSNVETLLQVQDELEHTNFASTKIMQSPFASLQHFVAQHLDSSNGMLADECPYTKARLDGKWPALPKPLPRQAAFGKTRPHYYLWTHSAWVFMGLLQLENEQYAPLHMSRDTFTFQINDTQLLQVINSKFYGTTVFQSTNRTGTGKVVLSTQHYGQVEFLVTILDKIKVTPSMLLLDVNCSTSAEVTGGSAHYRTSPSGYEFIHTNRVVIPAQSRMGEYSFRIWDAVWESEQTSQVQVRYQIHRITKFRMLEGRKVFANVGETVSLHVVGVGGEQCCSKLDKVWEFDPDMLIKLPEQATNPRKDFACAQAEFKTKDAGKTIVNFAGLKVEIEVLDPIDFTPASGVVMTVGCKQVVKVLNFNPQIASLTVNDVAVNGEFEITCTDSGLHTVVVKTAMHSKTFQYECIRPKTCGVELIHKGHTITNKRHLELGLDNIVVMTMVSDGVRHSFYEKCWTAQVYVNTSLLVGGRLVLDQLGLTTVTATVLGMECQPAQFQVSRALQIAPGSLLQYWADGCTEPVVDLVFGSGEFTSSHFTVLGSQLQLPKHDSSARYGGVLVEDVDFYPTTVHVLDVEFYSDISLELESKTEHVVQHFEIKLAVSPKYLDLVKVDSKLEWEPISALSLVSFNPQLGEYVLMAEQSGPVQVSVSLVAKCDPSKRLIVQKTFEVHPYRLVELLPGSQYNLLDCDGSKASTLSQCKVVQSSSSELEVTDAFVVSASNGTVQASCDSTKLGSTALVQCQPNHQYFALALVEVEQIVISPTSERWLANTPSNQVHFALAMKQHRYRHTTLIGDLCRPGSAIANEWRIDLSNAKTHYISTKQNLVSVFVQKDATLQVKATVTVGSQCKHHKLKLEATKKYSVIKLPTIINAGALILLPPGAQFDLESSEPVVCRFTCTECEDGTRNGAIWLEGCRIHTSTAVHHYLGKPIAYALSVFDSSSNEVAFFQTQVQVKQIASISLHSLNGGALQVTFHDEFTREFTPGWFDGATKRSLEFQVPAPVQVTRDSLINCTHKFVGQRVKLEVLSTTSMAGGKQAKRRAKKEANIVATLRGSDGMVVKASNVLAAHEWQCLGKPHLLLGVCLELYEFVVIMALLGTTGVLMLQQRFWFAAVFAVLLLAIFLYT